MRKDTERLEDLGQEIRRLWCSERRFFDLRNTGRSGDWGDTQIRRWDGGRSASGKFYKPVWPTIAAFCIDNNLEPHLLVKALFHNVMLQAPLPNMAHGNFALEKYRQYTSPATSLEIKSKIINEFESQKSKAHAEVVNRKKYNNSSEELAWKIVILDNKSSLSPLFRYCIAKNQNWDDIHPDYYEAAKRQYSRHPDVYDAVWQEWIPDTLKRETRNR